MSFDDHLCYRSGDWIPFQELTISVQDVGFRQGVIAVERLRTYGGQAFQTAAHLERWNQTVATLNIVGLPSCDQINTLIRELLSKNATLVDRESDVGITIFATPGVTGPRSPTLGLHLNRLDHDRIAHHGDHGQPLVLTSVQQPGEQCWPRSIKVRSRIHYHLADMAARQIDLDSIGILLDTDGSITETSVANLAIVRAGAIVSPPVDRVLGGITQRVVEQISKRIGIEWHYRPIQPAELTDADEVLLMGTDGGIWFANSIDQRSLGRQGPGPVLIALRQGFEAAIRN